MNKIFSFVLITVLSVMVSSLQAADPVAGKKVSAQCVACHGEDGNSPTPNFPRIAGQHEDYLFQALESYKTGYRKNPIMAGIVAALSEEDMKNVSAYFAAQSGLKKIVLDRKSEQ